MRGTKGIVDVDVAKLSQWRTECVDIFLICFDLQQLHARLRKKDEGSMKDSKRKHSSLYVLFSHFYNLFQKFQKGSTVTVKVRFSSSYYR